MSSPTAVIQDVPTRTEKFTFVLFHFDGEEKPRVISEDSANKAIEDKKGQIVASQTFGYDEANTDSGVAEVCTSERERVKLFNNGLSSKIQNKARSLMSASDEDGNYTFEPQEGEYNLREYASQETATRGQSALDKVKKLLGNLSPEQQAQVVALLQAQEATT